MNKKYCVDIVFNVIKLLQQGTSVYTLLTQGYDPSLVEKCQKIRNYLFICYKNEIERRSFKK